MEFKRRYKFQDLNTLGLLSLQNEISPEDTVRLMRIYQAWNFYDGYHWENIPPQDKPEVTVNYCRRFVDKFVAFELGKGFSIKYPEKIEKTIVTETGKNIVQYLEDIWKANKKNLFCIELGQSKSITGDGWVQVKFEEPGTYPDPFSLFPNGRIRILVIPTSIVFPEYDKHDKDILTKMTIAYPIEVETVGVVSRRRKVKKVIYKQVWTDKTLEIWEGSELVYSTSNKYGVIPFVQIKNFPIVGRTEGLGDLEDIIPLNVELNLKKSDVSEIIDYHSAPVTVVFGARISQLEKGANKIWGGLPKDAKVTNLELTGDLTASVNYIESIRKAIHEIGSIPEGALGSGMHISNTSGVALQLLNLPIIERVRIKRMSTKEGIEQINRLILLISLKEGLITKPNDISNYDFYSSEVIFPDVLPKDELIELQKIEQEMKLGLENREGAMERLGRKDIQAKLRLIDEDRMRNPLIYGLDEESTLGVNKEGKEKKLNSGLTNGETAIEQVRKEINGQNKA
ncbi:MAG: phage portal protein [Thermosipho sp. (in: Bacteria)]|nr:phage portal protein [Thermosipho sp. (in: thermotogales)]